ncbi:MULTISPECIES: acylphosphatase [Modicisalibacter]|uniref:acylphosphatase n=1 Tax=Modicisalibacter tunisiensis TaxID=390637 RepID=A0ABS7X0K4_9GAMM|nr:MULTISPECIES: acylphosphatase [Modicisalibacter]MBZ9568407.1 acylphosphatase [Modicisalibacter tunisiensis]
MSQRCVQARVTGKVQGVWFRAATQSQAREAGVTGYAVNCEDGSVEVVLCGHREAVDSVVDWLWQGPPAAQVAHVEAVDIDWQPHDDFTTH